MGVDFYCGDITFGCSYDHWGDIRKEIILATFDYIQDKYEKDKELYGNLSEYDENWIGEGSSYHCYMKDLMEMKSFLLAQKSSKNVFGIEMENTLHMFIVLCNDFKFINCLNRFDISGLLALCDQSDCEGYYTPGNSLDICSLFDRIEPFVKKYSCYDCIYNKEGRMFNRIYDVFEESYKTMKKVSIC
jgi:predicted small metal-binding protein